MLIGHHNHGIEQQIRPEEPPKLLEPAWTQVMSNAGLKSCRVLEVSKHVLLTGLVRAWQVVRLTSFDKTPGSPRAIQWYLPDL